jgi:N-acetylmuramoyl-L-alanine amidase
VRIVSRLLPCVEALPERNVADIGLLVLHSTEEPSLEDARRIAQESEDCISAHYYIDRDGSTEEWVPITRVARHVSGHNQASIGIELVNLGRSPYHFASSSQAPTEPFGDAQIEALEELIDILRDACPNLIDIKRHSDLDRRWVPAADTPSRTVRRRIDPGPLFPWPRVRDRFQERA